MTLPSDTSPRGPRGCRAPVHLGPAPPLPAGTVRPALPDTCTCLSASAPPCADRPEVRGPHASSRGGLGLPSRGLLGVPPAPRLPATRHAALRPGQKVNVEPPRRPRHTRGGSALLAGSRASRAVRWAPSCPPCDRWLLGLRPFSFHGHESPQFSPVAHVECRAPAGCREPCCVSAAVRLWSRAFWPSSLSFRNVAPASARRARVFSGLAGGPCSRR